MASRAGLAAELGQPLLAVPGLDLRLRDAQGRDPVGVALKCQNAKAGALLLLR